ncbi:uncharacterized protein LOC110060730 [Orbicella faveolata]|uniref:uncharacterized protein LOC110060730 n=1 Tax=Orbicella faveolata TaxID=48498 RepID=UPI0009E4E5C2|nr:uncharacterized protein LOC110060730 [Orbicella faveolata]
MVRTALHGGFVTSKLDDLVFVDDIALISSTKQRIQDKTTRLEEEARRVELKVSAGKPKVMRINARNQDKIVVNEIDIEDVDELTHLEAKVCKEEAGMKDLKNSQSKAIGEFIRLKNMWRSNSISRKTKLRLYKTLLVPVLLYACETWKMNKGDHKAIDVFHNKCLRKILRIKWQDHVSTKELLERASMKPLRVEVKYRRGNMIGHILWEDRNNDCNIAISWAPEGKRKREKLKTTWRRTVEKECKEAGWISWEETKTNAADREQWKNSVKAPCATRHAEDKQNSFYPYCFGNWFMIKFTFCIIKPRLGGDFC